MTEKRKWFYLSFSDGVFRGACVVDGTDIRDAIKTAWKNGCNPGGGVLSIEIEDIDNLFPPDKRYRLLTKKEIPAAKTVRV